MAQEKPMHARYSVSSEGIEVYGECLTLPTMKLGGSTLLVPREIDITCPVSIATRVIGSAENTFEPKCSSMTGRRRRRSMVPGHDRG